MNHDYIAQQSWMGDMIGVSAHCTCGWHSAYTHAFDSYAREDHEFHLQQVKENKYVPSGV